MCLVGGVIIVNCHVSVIDVNPNTAQYIALSSNSTCSICCGFAVRQVVQQINNESTANPQQIHNFSTNPQHPDMLRCCGFVVDSTANPQQIKTVEYGFRLVHNKSKSCTTNPQRYDKSNSLLYNKSTASPQQIEQVEFEL
jgi:hypothetical protein